MQAHAADSLPAAVLVIEVSLCLQVRILSQQGIKEVTLLGQNVNSYADTSAMFDKPARAGSDPAADPFAIYAEVSSILVLLIDLVRMSN